MKKSLLYLIIAVAVIIGAIVAFSTLGEKPNNSSCSQYSNKDGYTGCMSLVNGKEKKCKFKVDNKVNETTQQMEFTYTCSPK